MGINYDLIKKEKVKLLNSSFFTIDTIKSKKDLEIFMKSHVYSVWDFMSLLKYIQNEITCNKSPWKPSKYGTDLVRFINEIVLEEESDISNIEGKYKSHFELYLQAMEELGIDTNNIKDNIKNVDINNIDDFLNNETIPLSSRKFMKNTFSYIKSGDIVSVVSAFTFGRENIIPDMFIKIIKNLEISNIEASTLYFYFKRHIDLDGDSHGPLSKKLIEELIEDDEKKLKIVENSAISSIKARNIFWNDIKKEIENN